MKTMKNYRITLTKLIRLSIVLTITMFTMTSCTSIPESDYCYLYKPVYVSLNDTEETIKQIVVNNIVYESLCK